MAGVIAVWIEGQRLRHGAKVWRLRGQNGALGRRLATGDYLQTVPYSEPGHPLLPLKLSWSADWNALRDDGRLLESLLCIPKAYRFTLFRQIPVGYRGNGERTEFYLPKGWCPVDLVVDPLPSSVLDDVDHAATVDGQKIPLDLVAPAIFDTADPAPGEAWLRAFDAQDLNTCHPFKMGTPPAGEFVVYITPAHWVFRAPGPDERQIDAPAHEPMSLVLEEA